MDAEFIYYADLHYGRLESYLPKDLDWHEYSFRPLKQVERYAKENGISTVIDGGDLYDYMPTQEMQSKMSEFFKNVEPKWHVLNGNHAVKSPTQHGLVKLIQESKSWLTNVKFYTKPKAIKIDKTPIIFLPWPLNYHPLLKKYKKAIVIAHVDKPGFKLDNGRVCKGDDFKTYGLTWLIGHFHTFQEKDNCTFVGAPSQLRYGDCKDHYFLHVKVKKGKVSYKKILVNPGYYLDDIRIDTVDDIPQIKDLKKDTYYRVLNNVNVTVPEDLLAHRQIIKQVPYGSKRDLESIRSDSINIDYVGVTAQNREKLLMSYLKKGGALDKKEIKKAKELIKAEISEIQFEQTGLR